MKSLIGMTDFVLEQDKLIHRCDNKTFAKSVLKYAKFIKQPLELWMFVPCDEDGNVLINDNLTEYDREMYWDNELKFRQAKERCLFECFRYDGFKYLDCKNYSFRILEIKNMTIENLVKYNLQLTPAAIKQLAL